MARPTKYNEQRTDAILSALRAGNTRKAAVAYANVDYVTFLNWLARYSSFSEAVEKAEADAEIRAVAQIAKAANDGTWTAAAWWLERRRHQEYGRIDRVEVTIRERAKQIAAATGADPDWLVQRAEEIARESEAKSRA